MWQQEEADFQREVIRELRLAFCRKCDKDMRYSPECQRKCATGREISKAVIRLNRAEGDK